MATYKKRGFKPKNKEEEAQLQEHDSTTAEVFNTLDESASKTEEWVQKNQNYILGVIGVIAVGVLDAIYHLCFGKSYFNPVSTQNIKHGTEFFVIEGEFEKLNRTEKILCSFKKGTKKVIKRNDKPYEKFSEHIGFLPFAANRTFDRDTLSIYNEQMNTLGTAIHHKRVEFIESFLPIFKEQYQNISEKDEQIDLSYESQLSDDSLLNLLEKNIEKDRALQYTSVGVHKDDLSFTIAGHPIKKFGSQGQQKSFLIALKLAQFHFIKQLADTTPILLLDDIFDKLDENRVSHIVGLVKDDNFGQIFISDTHADRTEDVVKNIHQSYKIFNL